jgi:hypothetical protein
MGGASPPGSTDPIKKPAETKDGTAPLTPGQSPGITGASPGSATPAAAAAAAAGKGASIKIEPAATAPKATDSNPLFTITAEPKMPAIIAKATVVGVTTGADPTATTEFTWIATVSYDSKDTLNGVSSGKCSFKGAPAKGTTRKIDAITKQGKVTGGAIAVNFDQIRGGDLLISVTATVGGQVIKGETKGWRIQGTNPELADVNKMLPDDAFRKLTCLESQKKQFVASSGEGNAMYPQFSSDGCHGVGICQLTNPPPTDDQIWDWTANVKAGIVLYNEKRRVAKGYPALVAASPNFTKLVKEYTDSLSKAPAPAAAGAPAATGASAAAAPAPPAPSPAGAAAPAGAAPAAGVAAAPAATPPAPPKVKVPEFTEEQLQDDTIRGFNGWAGDDGLTVGTNGKPWLHEFRIKQDPKTKALVVEGDPKSGIVNAVWERVPTDARPSSGDPGYVDDVKSYDPNTCSRSKKK